MVNEDFHGKLRKYSITGIIILVFVILVAVAFVIFFNKGETGQNIVETPGATYPSGELLRNSVCTTDNECAQYGQNYYCFSGACYYAYTALNDTSGRQSGGGGSGSGSSADTGGGSGLLGFFANFLTGKAVSESAGDVIYYDDGWVGIGTGEPLGALTVESMNDDSAIQARQGELSLFTGSADFVYNAGNDGIYVFTNTNTSGNTIFNPGAYFTFQNAKVGIGTTTPSEALSVVGNIYATGVIRTMYGGGYPSCNSANYGALYTSSTRLYVCTENGWKYSDLLG